MAIWTEYLAFMDYVLDLAPFLDVADLQRLRIVSDRTKCLLDDPQVWQAWIENVLPNFIVSKELLQLSKRAALHTISTPLFGLKVVESDCLVPIEDKDNGQALSNLVREIRDRQHQEKTIASTQVVLGCMRFPNGIISSSGRSPIASLPITFGTTKELRDATGIKGKRMSLELAWIGGELFAKIEDGMPASLGNLITVDLNSFDAAARSDKRNSTLRVNESSWQPLNGVSTFRNGKAAVSEHVQALTEGVMVTIFVRSATQASAPPPIKQRRFSYPW